MLHTKAVKYLLLVSTLFTTNAQASVLDLLNLKSAYNYYEKGDYNQSKNKAFNMQDPSLQSQVLLANSYYNLAKYKRSIVIYNSIKSTNKKTKQLLFYNSATAYAHIGDYEQARAYYAKVLQLGEDDDALYNLKLISVLEKKKSSSLGIAHPKSQNAKSSKNNNKKEDEENEEKEEDQQSSNSGSGDSGKSKQEKNKEKKNKRLKMDTKEEKQPLSSKTYELINKGYIREKQPW